MQGSATRTGRPVRLACWQVASATAILPNTGEEAAVDQIIVFFWSGCAISKNVLKTFNKISMKIEQVGVARLPNPGEEPPKWSERPRGGDVRWSSAAVRILWPAGAAPRMHCTVEKSPQAEGSN